MKGGVPPKSKSIQIPNPPRPEHPKSVKDEEKQARSTQNQPEGPPARSQGLEGPNTFIPDIWHHYMWRILKLLHMCRNCKFLQSTIVEKSEIHLVGIYTVLLQNLFCRDLRASM